MTMNCRDTTVLSLRNLSCKSCGSCPNVSSAYLERRFHRADLLSWPTTTYIERTWPQDGQLYPKPLICMLFPSYLLRLVPICPGHADILTIGTIDTTSCLQPGNGSRASCNRQYGRRRRFLQQVAGKILHAESTSRQARTAHGHGTMTRRRVWVSVDGSALG